MKNKDFRKISRLLNILILILTIVITIYTINYLNLLRKEFIGENTIKMNCGEEDSNKIKQILKNYYNNEGISNSTINNFINNNDLIIKSASTWMDFNNRKYKITYRVDGKNNKYEFLNDSIEELYEYIQNNKIEYTINYNFIYTVLWSSFFTVIIAKVIFNFYKKPE